MLFGREGFDGLTFLSLHVEFFNGILCLMGLSKTSACYEGWFRFLYWSIISMQF